MAAKAGADSIDHGAYLGRDEEAIAIMADRGTFYVPTLLVFSYHRQVGADFRRRKAMEAHEEHKKSIQKALDAGIRIAMGTDAGAYGHGHHARELELLVEAGLTPMQAIVASTGTAAACIGLDKEVGTLGPGKYADLLLVEGDPLADVRVLQDRARLRMVMKGGVRYVDRVA